MAAKKAARKQAGKPQETEPDLPLVAQLKEAIRASGRTHYAIGKETGLSPSLIDRFMAGDGGLRLESAARIAAVLNQRLTGETPQKSV